MDREELIQAVPMELVIELLGGEIHGVASSGWTSVTCPFHGDNIPSAGVSPDGTGYNCMGCSVRGNVFDVLIKGKVVKDYKGAMHWLEGTIRNMGGRITES